MTALLKFAPEQQMTIEEFLAFTKTRPDDGRWEPIEGVPFMNAAPVDDHQVIVTNIASYLMQFKNRTNASWTPMLGIGTRVPISPNSLPQPDVFVKQGALTGTPDTDDALVIFEVLSRSISPARLRQDSKRDQEWREQVYSSVPNCQHYVTVSLKTVDVCAFDRATDWQQRRLRDLAVGLELAAIEVEMPVAAIYRWTPLGTPQPAQKRKR